MFRSLVLSCVFAGAALGLAADPPKFPDWPQLPFVPNVMPPSPAPASGDVSLLPKGVLYVVQHNGDPAQLLVSPPTAAVVREYSGKVAIDGVFVDAKVPGEAEFREYEAKQVFVVKRLQPGPLELIKAPKGAVERKMLTDGVAPKPPDPGPGPTPPDPPPTPAKTFRVIFTVESGQTMTAQQLAVVYGREVEEWLVKNATGGKDGFRRRDKDNPAVTGAEMSKIWEKARPEIKRTPAVIVEKNGHIEIIDLAGSPRDMIAVFQEYLDGKRGK